MDGFELLQHLRNHELTSHIPGILLTAKADIQSKLEGLQRGADAYLEKPFNKDELLIRIQKLLEMRKQLQQYYLKQSGVVHDVESPVDISGVMMDSKKEDAFVVKVREAVEANLTDTSFSVEKLCKLVFISHSQLHRKLDALTGCSPNPYGAFK